ncbi:Respiratory burst oxidase protein [Wickerhamomyces ciferrii]|uniref:ferric-chelate reductase (NADPH) n=1 Tax=Wickerhamomyces ciferrii (strain ATCC 14091 / BCRC 22168 / CBS 111 / JCM 3599 / NBRC 0793 / NRRL Y-1031 F-60-10) TaxID=1206466 RepID=K0KCS0_WICCF|nr:Respiratory burst oxidase protein [Wickerhamomyces ciferrii]CCH42885.1 Respiratory burst oxidase protein [Wickerhamomyces ciferrii]
MTVTYKGLDCLADKDNQLYKDLKKISQSGKNAWGYQVHYGYYVVYFGIVLIFLTFLKNIYFKYNDYSYRNSKIGFKHYRLSIMNKIIGVSRYISYKKLPIIISRITGLPSSFGTLFIIISSTLFIFCYCFIPKIWIRPCKGFGSPPLAVRAGLMCMGLTPYLYLLSGKTNFISGITGISYEKLNIFHQGLGWGSLFLGLVHTVPFFTQPVAEGGYSNLNKVIKEDALYVNGIFAIVALLLLCLLSTRFSRKLCYEVFFHSHWILGLVYFAALTWHIYGELKADNYMWATLGFWCFQMIHRAIVKTTFKPNIYSFKSKLAFLTLHKDSGIFEVNIPISNTYEFNWKPGQHIFIRFVLGISTLDNHPFSIMSIPSSSKNSEIKLIVKPHKGLTGKIYNSLLNNKGDRTLKTYIDGPYGGMNRDVLSFDQVTLLATGSGVTVTWSFFEYIVKNLEIGSNAITEVNFVWIIRSIDCLDWISKELVITLNKIIEIQGNLDGFSFDIYVSNSNEITPKQSDDESTPETSKLIPSTDLIDNGNFKNHLNIHYNVKPQMTNYLQSLPISKGKNCFIVSGTNSFQNDVGNGVSQLQRYVLQDKAEEIYLHSENFGW